MNRKEVTHNLAVINHQTRGCYMQKYFAISPAETQCNEEYEFNLFERRKEAR